MSYIDLSSMLSKDGETRNEVDMMLSTLGTPQPHSSLQPYSTEQHSSPQAVDVARPSSTDEIRRETPATSGPCSTSHESHLMMGSASENLKEAPFSSINQLHVHDSNTFCPKSDRALVTVDGNLSVSEASGVSHSNQNGDVVPLTSSLSAQLDLDRSIAMTTALTTSTPLDMEESTPTRTVPSSSACIVNMEQQFATEHASLTRGQFVNGLR